VSGFCTSHTTSSGHAVGLVTVNTDRLDEELLLLVGAL
jgi:hypothetical protein